MVQADEPGWVIVSQLDDPQWSARWSSLEGEGDFDAEIRPAFRKPGETAGGWQHVKVPFNGRWTLRLTYEPRDVVEGTGDLDAWPGLCAGSVLRAPGRLGAVAAETSGRSSDLQSKSHCRSCNGDVRTSDDVRRAWRSWGRRATRRGS